MGDLYYLVSKGRLVFESQDKNFLLTFKVRKSTSGFHSVMLEKDKINNKLFTQKELTNLAKIQDSIHLKEPRSKKDILNFVNAIIKKENYKLKKNISKRDRHRFDDHMKGLTAIKEFLETSKNKDKYIYTMNLGPENNDITPKRSKLILKKMDEEYNKMKNLNPLKWEKYHKKHWDYEGRAIIESNYMSILNRDLSLNKSRILTSYTNLNKSIIILVNFRLNPLYLKQLAWERKNSFYSGSHLDARSRFDDNNNLITRILLNNPNYFEKLVNNWIKLAEYADKYPHKAKNKHLVAVFIISWLEEMSLESAHSFPLKSWIDNKQKRKIEELVKSFELEMFK
jgi:hypothetical protein